MKYILPLIAIIILTSCGSTPVKNESAPIAAVDSLPLSLQLDSALLDIKTWKETDAKNYDALLASYADLVLDGDTCLQPGTKQKAEALRPYVKKFQIAFYPQLRKGFVSYEKEFPGLTASVGGDNSTILSLTWFKFAYDGNIDDMQRKIKGELKAYRFKEVRYEWDANATHYTSYKLHTYDDDRIVRL